MPDDNGVDVWTERMLGRTSHVESEKWMRFNMIRILHMGLKAKACPQLASSKSDYV